MPFIDNQVTRFNNGVNNEDVGSVFNSLRYPSHIGSHVFEEDFYTFTAGQWTETDVQGVNTVAIADGDGGIITLTLAGADDDEVALQRVAAGITVESWLFDPDRRFFIDILATLDEVVLSEMLVGLAITDATLLPAPTDGLYFHKAEGAGLVTLDAVKDSNETSVDVGTIVDATQFRLSVFYDGEGTAGRLYGALDGVVGGFSEPGANFPDDEELTVSFAVRAGEIAAKVLTIDRVFTSQER